MIIYHLPPIKGTRNNHWLCDCVHTMFYVNCQASFRLRSHLFMPFSIKSVAPQSQVTGDQKQRQRHPSSRHKPFPSSLEKRLHEMPTHIWLLSTCALIIIANIYPRLTIANTFFLIPQRGQAVARCGRIQRRNQIRFANFQYLSRDPMFSIFDAENRHDWWNLVVNFKDSRNTFLFCHRTLFVLKRINKKI